MTSDSLFARRPDDLRSSVRLPCSTAVKARLLRTAGPTKVPPGQEFDTRTINVSKGGAMIRNGWPLNEGDLLVLLLKQADGSVIPKHAEVVNARRSADGGHLAGLRFLSNEEVTALDGGSTLSNTSGPSPQPR